MFGDDGFDGFEAAILKADAEGRDWAVLLDQQDAAWREAVAARSVCEWCERPAVESDGVSDLEVVHDGSLVCPSCAASQYDV